MILSEDNIEQIVNLIDISNLLDIKLNPIKEEILLIKKDLVDINFEIQSINKTLSKLELTFDNLELQN